MNRFLCHDRLMARFPSMLGLSAILFLLAWALSYALLPEGILRGRTPAGVIPGEQGAESFLAEFVPIAAYNLVGMMFVLASNWVFKVRCYPLGYLLPLYMAASYGTILGTNSFAIPLEEPMAPSLEVFSRSGVYEIAAYALMATATYGISAYRVKRFIPPDSEKITPTPRPASEINWVGFALAIVVLLASNAWEAYSIVYIA